MGAKTEIQWTDATWSPIRGCSRVSEGCLRCYAERMAHRFSGHGYPYEGLTHKVNGHPTWTGEVRFIEDALRDPLKWKEPRRIFVNSMSDLFHEDLSFDVIDKIFAVMALCPQHTFQVLSKRPGRMLSYCADRQTPFRISRQIDSLLVYRESQVTKEEIRQIHGYPNYWVSNLGFILSGNGSAVCLYCGGSVDGIASKKYCSQKCRQNACYLRRTGRRSPFEATLTTISPDAGEQGHLRVMLYRDGKQQRELVHRLVLSAFDRAPNNGEQGCHVDGIPSNNHICNLRWGTQEDNWEDRKRHGNAHSYGKRHTVTPHIRWPLPNCWKGVSCEDQKTADERIPLLLQTPAAVRWISAEPMLADLKLKWPWVSKGKPLGGGPQVNLLRPWEDPTPLAGLDWVVCGGESGPGARPMEPDWARSLRDQCQAAGVPFFFKQGSKANWPDFKSFDSFPKDLQVREYPDALQG